MIENTAAGVAPLAPHPIPGKVRQPGKHQTSFAATALTATFCRVALLGLIATGAFGQINASKIVTGTQTQINWLMVEAAPTVHLGSGLTYRGRAQARVASEPYTYYAGAPWYQPFSPTVAYPEVDRYLALPDFVKSGQAYHYLYSPAERARVDMKLQRESTPSAEVSAHTSGTGKGSSSLSYAVRIQHSGQTASYFLSVRNPTHTSKFQPAIDYPAGGYNAPAVALAPEAVDSRVAVDILAGTVPFYSSERTYHYPPGTPPGNNLRTTWGAKPLDGQQTLVYLGRFNSGDTATLNLIVRADVNTKASKCGLQWGVPGPWTLFCADATELLQVGHPGDTSTIPAITVFAKTGLEARP